MRSVAVLGHSIVQQVIALEFSNAARSATLLRPGTGALRPNLNSHQSEFSNNHFDLTFGV